MPLLFEKGDITLLKVDAIVNAANSSLLGGGGVDGCIHRAAGPGLLEECKTLHGCATGDAKITKGYNLPAKHVIHTVGPIWCGGNRGEKEKLVSCYKRSLEVASENGCQTVAFPLISAGVYRYPKDKARDVAIETINDFLFDNDSEMTVYLVFYDGPVYDDLTRLDKLFRSELTDILLENQQTSISKIHSYSLNCVSASYCIDYDKREKSEEPSDDLHEEKHGFFEKLLNKKTYKKAKEKIDLPIENNCCLNASLSRDEDLDDDLRNILAEGTGRDKSFSEKLQSYIKKRGISNAECYRYANVSRQVFSNIISNDNYIPKKHVALALAVSLKLDLNETNDLLQSAGFALSGYDRFDIIVGYFIRHKKYDIFRINGILQEYNEKQLGNGY